jgi:hypothetical protein
MHCSVLFFFYMYVPFVATFTSMTNIFSCEDIGSSQGAVSNSAPVVVVEGEVEEKCARYQSVPG